MRDGRDGAGRGNGSGPFALAERDVVFVGGPTDDGDGLKVLRARKRRLELAELRALKSGQPIHGEVIRLHPTAEHERMYDVETLLEPSAETRSHSGPARVASDAYRRGWQAIFGAEDTGDDPAPDPAPDNLN